MLRSPTMFTPHILNSNATLPWSPGTGVDVQQMLNACRIGDLVTVARLTEHDPSLVRCQHNYRTPISFAVRGNHFEVARYLLDHGADPLNTLVGDNLQQVCVDRGYAELHELLTQRLFSLHNASEAGEIVAAAIRARDLPATSGGERSDGRRMNQSSPDQHAATWTGSGQNPGRAASPTREQPLSGLCK